MGSRTTFENLIFFLFFLAHSPSEGEMAAKSVLVQTSTSTCVHTPSGTLLLVPATTGWTFVHLFMYFFPLELHVSEDVTCFILPFSFHIAAVI